MRALIEFSAKIARNTQLILQEELGITNVVDPLAGSYYVETLTNELCEKAWEQIEEIEKLGGMTKAVELGLPKRRIEESAGKQDLEWTVRRPNRDPRASKSASRQGRISI